MPDAGKLFVGTSGYSYKEWKGSFYPEKLPDREMLSFYAKQFSTVEINHSFYRMPTENLLMQLAKSVPEGFRFALKANQQITHIQRLRGCESTLKRFLEVASVLNDGDHLGPVLVQLPPTFKFDRPLLEDFLALRAPAPRKLHSEATDRLEKTLRPLACPGRRRLRLLQARRCRQSAGLRSPAHWKRELTPPLSAALRALAPDQQRAERSLPRSGERALQGRGPCRTLRRSARPFASWSWQSPRLCDRSAERLPTSSAPAICSPQRVPWQGTRRIPRQR